MGACNTCIEQPIEIGTVGQTNCNLAWQAKDMV